MTEDLSRHTRAAAQVIADAEAPSEWLLSAVRRMADEVAYVINADARTPKRTDLRQNISLVRDASKLIDVMLFPFMHGGSGSLLLLDHLLRDGEYRIEYESQFRRMLVDLCERCGEALERVPEGAGQSRISSRIVESHTSSSSVICALAVQILWKEIRSRLPGLNSEQAHHACSELWLAAGGKGTKSAGWRSDLKEARASRYARQGATLAGMVGVQGIHPQTP